MIQENNYLYKILVIIAMVVQCVFVFYMFTYQKKGFFIDEISQYEIANNSDNEESQFLFLKYDMEEDAAKVHNDKKVITGEDIRQSLTAQEEEGINVPIKNGIRDTKGLLSYILLHFVCKMFPDQFSGRYMFFINFASFLITQVFLYLYLRQTLSERVSFFTTLCYGFSAGAVNAAIFLRPYMLGAACMMTTLYFYEKYNKDGKIKSLIGFFISCFLLVMTDYLPLIVVGVYAMMRTVFLIKDGKQDFKRLGILIGSGALSCIIIELTTHMLSSQIKVVLWGKSGIWGRGIEESIIKRFAAMLDVVIKSSVWYNWIILLVFIALIVFLLYQTKNENKEKKKNKSKKNKTPGESNNNDENKYRIISLTCAIFIVCLAIAIVMSDIVRDSISDRLTLFAYPAVSAIAGIMIELVKGKKQWIPIAALAVCMLINIFTLPSNSRYLFKGCVVPEYVSKQSEGKNVFVMGYDLRTIIEVFMPGFMQANDVTVTEISENYSRMYNIHSMQKADMIIVANDLSYYDEEGKLRNIKIRDMSPYQIYLDENFIKQEDFSLDITGEGTNKHKYEVYIKKDITEKD